MIAAVAVLSCHVTFAGALTVEGGYPLAPDTVFSVTRSDSGFVGHLTGWTEPQIMQASGSSWYLPVLDTEIVFRRNEKVGRVEVVLQRYLESATGLQTASGEFACPTGMGLEARLVRMIPAWMARYHCPAVSMALIDDGRVAWHHEFGIQAATLPLRIDEHTVFEACSMGKAFFAYRALMLVDQGRLDLDRPLDDYLPQPWAPDVPQSASITARMVLNHTSGLPNWRKGSLRLVAPPGTKHTYSGEGITYLQRVVEQLLARPVDEFMRDDLILPLGMARSSYLWREDFASNYARGHGKDGRPRNGKRFTRANAAVTLYTTPLDFARYVILMMDPSPSEQVAISDELRRRMLSPRRLPSGKVTIGLGWELYREDGEKTSYVYHVGANSGFRCQARFYPDTGDGIVIMTNSDNGRDLYEAVLRQVYP